VPCKNLECIFNPLYLDELYLSVVASVLFILSYHKTDKSFAFEVSALKKEIDDLIKKLQPLGLASASRTGVVAMTKGSEIYKQN